MASPTYQCGIDAEPLHRYQPGGYHPVRLGDVLHNGRYRILHKMGWGGWSTTWAARDQEKNWNIAIKIPISETPSSPRELRVLQAISALPKSHAGSLRINQMLDSFTLQGPNGTHECLVLQLLGPNVADAVEWFCHDDRLPAEYARVVAFQALQGIDFLARHRIGHGDVHIRNIAFEIPALTSLDEEGLQAKLGKPEIGIISEVENKPLPESLPPSIVHPARFREQDVFHPSSSIQIIDFGEAFLQGEVPHTLHTPLSVRAPEIIFQDVFDHRVDLWSVACLVFELVTGQPPFDTIMIKPAGLVAEMIATATDPLPSRWNKKWQTMRTSRTSEAQYGTLDEWLHEVYYNNDQQPGFTKQEISDLARLVARLLQMDPSLRATAGEVLSDNWFKQLL